MRKKLLLQTSKACLALLFCFLSIGVSLAQNRTISGTVTDTQNQPVIGAAVMVVGNTRIGAATDMNGAFSLSVPAGASITVESIGYKSRTFAIGSQTVFNIVLEEDTEMLEETVVIGYGVQKKSDLTGAVASIKDSDMSNRSAVSPVQALQGKAAGVQIVNASGAPGSEASIQIRGYSSNSKTTPLMIVDGLKVSDIDYLDPDNIASIEVLKDAASAAIYGIEAGNGVILVTTKSGKGTPGRGRVFYNFMSSTQTASHLPDLMDAKTYVEFQELMGNNSRNFWDGKTDTYWPDYMLEKGQTFRHTVGAQAANDRGNIYVALTYVDDNGIITGDKDILKRLSGQINAEYKINDWLTVGTNNTLQHSRSRSVSEAASLNNSTLGAMLMFDPIVPWTYDMNNLPQDIQNKLDAGLDMPRDPNGNIYGISSQAAGSLIYHPAVMRDRADTDNDSFSLRGSTYVNITPLKGLVFTSRFGYRAGYTNVGTYNYPYRISDVGFQDMSITGTSRNNLFYQWENFANYNHTFGKHALGAMAGMSYTFTDSRGVNASLRGPDILKGYAENFLYLTQDNGKGEKGIGGGTPNNSSQISYFGRLTYSYDNRYSLQANFRADAFDSSKLSVKNRWGYFPSVSAGWTISNEDWFNVPAINFLKFRGSWGVNGNIAVLSGYPYSTSISYNSKSYQYDVDHGDIISYGSQPDGLANPDLTWETSVQTDLGLDLRMFNNRLTFTFDWFNKDTKDLLVNISPVAEVGISSTTVNAGAINNTGLEFELGWQDHIGDFGYSINANLSTLKNNVTYLEPSVGHITGDGFSNYKLKTYFQEGYPVWFLRGYEYAGMNGDGVAQYVAADGSLTTTPTSDDLKFIGNTLPTYTYGVTLRMDWKGIDLTVFGTGAGGNSLVPCVFRTEHPQINSLEYFHAQAGKTIPTVDKIYNSVDFWSSSATVFKGDFFKIKQIQLGYTLPRAISSKIMISNLRLYASMDDWFVFTNYPGFDPETATTGGTRGKGLDKGQYPNAKKLLFGVNIAF